jgi:hypothetical protein
MHSPYNPVHCPAPKPFPRIPVLAVFRLHENAGGGYLLQMDPGPSLPVASPVQSLSRMKAGNHEKFSRLPWRLPDPAGVTLPGNMISTFARQLSTGIPELPAGYSASAVIT